MTLEEAMMEVKQAKEVYDRCVNETQLRQGNYNVAKQELEATQATRNTAMDAYKAALKGLQTVASAEVKANA